MTSAAIESVLEIEIWLGAITVVALGALVISVCAFFVASKNSEQMEDAADKANEAHEIATGISLDDAAVYGTHAKGKK